MALHGGLSFCKTQQVALLALTVLVLNGSLFRNLTLVSYWASLSALFFLQRSLRLVELLETHGHSTRQKTRPAF